MMIIDQKIRTPAIKRVRDLPIHKELPQIIPWQFFVYIFLF
jgi:hypothetical protein